MVDWCVDIIKYGVALSLEILAKYPWVWQIGLAGFGLVAITALIAIIKAGKTKTKPKKDKQAQSKKSK